MDLNRPEVFGPAQARQSREGRALDHCRRELPRKLRVLIVCGFLDARGGTQLYVRDVAMSLLRLGHTPVVYASSLGPVATEIRNMTIPVTDRIDALAVIPDLIYGQDHLSTMMAVLHYSDVPAIYVCHNWYGENAFAPRFPRILRFVAVDVTCHDRLVFEDGVGEERVKLIPSFVDLSRFQRRSPLPEKARRALVFGNYTGESPYLSALRQTCARRGIHLDVIGAKMNNSVSRPEEVLKDYDIVFAKGRAALEALAVGAAVISYSGVRLLGQMVKAKDVERLLPLNLGIRAMGDVLTPEELASRVDAELDEYDREDAEKVTAVVRARAGLATAMMSVVELCEEVVTEYSEIKDSLDPTQEGLAVAAYLRRLESFRAARRQNDLKKLQPNTRVKEPISQREED